MAGQQPAGQHNQPPACQHGEQPFSHHAQQAATGQQSAGQEPVCQHAEEAAHEQPTREQATAQASGKKPSPSSRAFLLTYLYFCSSSVCLLWLQSEITRASRYPAATT